MSRRKRRKHFQNLTKYCRVCGSVIKKGKLHKCEACRDITRAIFARYKIHTDEQGEY